LKKAGRADEAARVKELVRPALRDDGFEVGAHEALVTLFEGRMQIEDGLARAVDEAGALLQAIYP